MPKLGIHLTKKPLCYKCYYNNAHIQEFKNVQKWFICHNNTEVKIVMTKIDEAIVLKQFQVNELSDIPKLRMIMEEQQIKPKFSLLAREL